MQSTESGIYRVIDANLNRLREGIRVIEEYFRFIIEDKDIAVELKELRHQVQKIEKKLDSTLLLDGRDSQNDIFSSGTVALENSRESINNLLSANIRRAEESSRVLEEYLKLLPKQQRSIDIAKKCRFKMYSIEKRILSDEK